MGSSEVTDGSSSVAVLRPDHFVFAAPDVGAAVDELERRLGVRATPGGKHVGLGTHNSLLALGEDVYLEVIGPDPEQPDPAQPRPFGIDTLRGVGRLVTWACKAPDLQARVESARAAGYDPGAVMPLKRAAPGGQLLEWRLTLRPQPAGDGLVPFLIDWGQTPSPALSAPKGCTVIDAAGEHPDPAGVAERLGALGARLRIHRADAPALILTLDTPRGRVELR